MKKKKLLFIVNTLAQHGAERYLFELCKALNENLFEIEVLSIASINKTNNYYQKYIEELGIKVNAFEKNDLFQEMDSSIYKRLKTSFFYRTNSNEIIKAQINHNLKKHLKNYDNISILKWEVYSMYPDVFDSFNNLYIHLLSGIDQYTTNPYLNLSNQKHNFIIMYEDQANEVLKTKFNNIKNKDQLDFFVFPLGLSSEQFLKRFSPCKEEFRIGVFTRIDPDQPSLFHLYVLHDLIQEFPKLKLYFFGKNKYPPYIRLYQDTIRMLNLENNIVMVGHVPNVANAIEEYQINLGCMNSINEFIGYSSIEMISTELPTVFFNIAKEKKVQNSFICNNLMDYKKVIKNVISGKIDNNQFNDSYKMDKKIKLLEKYYINKNNLS